MEHNGIAAKRLKKPSAASRNQRDSTTDFTDFTDKEFPLSPFQISSLLSQSVSSVKSVVKSSRNGAILTYRSTKSLLFMGLLCIFAAIHFFQSVVHASDYSVWHYALK